MQFLYSFGLVLGAIGALGVLTLLVDRLFGSKAAAGFFAVVVLVAFVYLEINGGVSPDLSNDLRYWKR